MSKKIKELENEISCLSNFRNDKESYTDLVFNQEIGDNNYC